MSVVCAPIHVAERRASVWMENYREINVETALNSVSHRLMAGVLWVNSGRLCLLPPQPWFSKVLFIAQLQCHKISPFPQGVSLSLSAANTLYALPPNPARPVLDYLYKLCDLKCFILTTHVLFDFFLYDFLKKKKKKCLSIFFFFLFP